MYIGIDPKDNLTFTGHDNNVFSGNELSSGIKGLVFNSAWLEKEVADPYIMDSENIPKTPSSELYQCS